MAELMMLVVLAVMIGAVVGGWRLLSRTDAELIDDARSTVVPGANGTMLVAVANPASEAVVVTACARPAASIHFRSHIRRSPTPRSVAMAHHAARQLLGTVGPGEQANWVVVGDATTARTCRVLLSLYQPDGRVRVHEHLVQVERSGVAASADGRTTSRPPHHSTTD